MDLEDLHDIYEHPNLRNWVKMIVDINFRHTMDYLGYIFIEEYLMIMKILDDWFPWIK